MDETRIMLRRPNERWHTPHVDAYDNERALQDLLLESPELIPGVTEAAVIDEMSIPDTGSVDLVLVDPTGAVTLIECKLVDNPEIRRAVVGQIMAYAANLWRLTYEDFDARFHRRLGESLADSVEAALADSSEWDQESFRSAVSENLELGRFRLIIAVDRITEELKRTVEYINTHTTTDLELLAFELGYIADNDIEILLPRLHGQESARMKAAAIRPAIKWTIDDLIQTIHDVSTTDNADVAKRLVEEVKNRGGRLRSGTGKYPAVSGDIEFPGGKRALWAILGDPSGPSAPRVTVNFGSLRSVLSREELDSLLVSLESIDGLGQHLTGVRDAEFNHYPTIPLATLASPGTLERFLDAFDGILPHPPSGSA